MCIGLGPTSQLQFVFTSGCFERLVCNPVKEVNENIQNLKNYKKNLTELGKTVTEINTLAAQGLHGFLFDTWTWTPNH